MLIKLKYLLIGLIVISSFIGVGQNAATKEETVDWLKNRLKYNKQWEEKTYEILEVVKYDYEKDILYYKVQYTWSVKDGGYRIDAIPIKEINPERLKIVRNIGDEGD